MESIKIEIPEVIKTPEVQQVSNVENMRTTFSNRHPAFRVPANWIIDSDEQSSDGDAIIAVNNVTRDYFEGTIEDFNSMLKD